MNIVLAIYNDRACPNGVLACVVQQPSKHIECFPDNFYYGECKVNNSNKCDPEEGAVLPAITPCRQKGYLPPKERDKKRKRPTRR